MDRYEYGQICALLALHGALPKIHTMSKANVTAQLYRDLVNETQRTDLYDVGAVIVPLNALDTRTFGLDPANQLGQTGVLEIAHCTFCRFHGISPFSDDWQVSGHQQD
jgi:hypothetical protein